MSSFLVISALVFAADAVQLVFDNFAFRDASASLNNSASPGSFGTLGWRTLSGTLQTLSSRRVALVPNTSVVYPSTLGYGGPGFTALSPFNASLLSLLSPFTNNATTNLYLSVLAFVPRNMNWRVGFGFANKHLTAPGGGFDASTPNASNSFAFGFRVDNAPATTLAFRSSFYNVTRATGLPTVLTAANLTYDEQPTQTTVVPVLTIMRLVPIKTAPFGYELGVIIQSSSALTPLQPVSPTTFNLQDAGNVTFANRNFFPTSLALYGFNCTVAQVRLVTTIGELFVAPPTPAPTPAPTPRPTPKPTPLPPGATLPPPPPPTPPTPAPSSPPDESFPPVPTPAPPRSTVAPTSASPAPASAAPVQSDDSSLPIIIGCVVGGVALLGAGAGVLFVLKKRKEAANGSMADVSFKRPQYAAIPRKPTESIGAYGNVDLSQNVGTYGPAGSEAVGVYSPPGMIVGAYGPADVGDTFRSASSASKPSEYSAIELSTSPVNQQW